ncbi:hypothetical protein RchiOBHm_Chr6g0278881 [Rosa chinensis]|uniref:Uncharacterized protein n=1 Tax=Rosa chinensis TaxID=74649 RepID=A0A2P6PSV0_ROSCH|nr:hypothetical protein RchiOBHm_Chr6g0278881 [Rosa chinensis]
MNYIMQVGLYKLKFCSKVSMLDSISYTFLNSLISLAWSTHNGTNCSGSNSGSVHRDRLPLGQSVAWLTILNIVSVISTRVFTLLVYPIKLTCFIMPTWDLPLDLTGDLEGL